MDNDETKGDYKMSANQEQSMNRLLKKLSALRATLRKDERDLLDAFVLSASGSADEVAAHSLAAAKVTAAKATSKAAEADEARAHSLAAAKVTAAKATSKASGADEARAHSLAAAKVTAAKATSKASEADEVAAQSMVAAKVMEADEQAVIFVRTARVVLDEQKQSFRLF
jgi:hypothetical protein